MNHGLGMTVFVLRDQRVAYIADLAVPKRVLFTVVPDFNIKEWELTSWGRFRGGLGVEYRAIESRATP